MDGDVVGEGGQTSCREGRRVTRRAVVCRRVKNFSHFGSYIISLTCNHFRLSIAREVGL